MLAARRGGIKTVIIPDENQRDLKEIPDNIKDELEIKPVKWIDEVLEVALQYQPTPLTDEEAEAVAEQQEANKTVQDQISTH